VTLRPLAEADLEPIVALLHEPEALQWWDEVDEDMLRADYLAPESDARAFAIEVDGDLIGIVAYWEESAPEYRHAGMDITLAASHRRQGLGRDTLRTLATYLFTERGHWRLTIDPDTENAPAIRSYEAIGFRPVGVLRHIERRSDGTFRDGLLMDMLEGELR